MSYVIEQQKRLMFEKLQMNNELFQKDIEDIVYSLQLASGNASGVGKIKGIMQFQELSPVFIVTKNDKIKISDKFELANLIKSIDEYIDIASDRDFKDYF